MALTPMDIHHKEFKTQRFNGYNEEEVDSFLDMIADELERMIQEGVDLRQQQEHLTRRLAEFEEMQSSLQSALLAATKSAEAMKEQARQESDAMTAKAQEEADGLIRSAQEQARQMMLRAQNERQKMERENGKLAELRKRYLLTIREYANEHLRQVTDWESRDIGETPLEEPPVDEPAGDEPAPPLLVETPPVQPTVSEPAPQTPPVMELPAPAPAEPQPIPEAPPAAPPPTEAAAPLPSEPPTQPPVEAAAPAPVSAEPAPAPVEPPAVVRGASRVPHVKMPDEQPGRPAPEPGRVSAGPKVEAQPSLVDEVLAIDGGEDIYSEFLEGEPDEQEKGRKGRREKKDKHFFWE
ncbi:MAG: DivIVA domain-containing protein [Actinobacteria bacterium]|nr:DivIVA domain-containing protein [Actinomycetota bacterium]MBU1942844.1 DivIVA domain-containing protein [Actinomycetota bacterium]MBU2687576.1 DivIVA domain-containing protein [Actinomycetota bacterium]